MHQNVQNGVKICAKNFAKKSAKIFANESAKKSAKCVKNCVKNFLPLCKNFAKILHFSNLHSVFRPREDTVIGRDSAMSGSIYTLFLPYMYGYKTYQIPIGIYTCPVFFIIEFMDTYINPDNDSHKIERTKMSYGEVLI